MLSKTLENEILKNLNLLEKNQQNRVLNYIKSLLIVSKSSQTEMLKFAGSFDPLELQQINKAIEEGCENVDDNEW